MDAQYFEFINYNLGYFLYSVRILENAFNCFKPRFSSVGKLNLEIVGFSVWSTDFPFLENRRFWVASLLGGIFGDWSGVICFTIYLARFDQMLAGVIAASFDYACI